MDTRAPLPYLTFSGLLTCLTLGCQAQSCSNAAVLHGLSTRRTIPAADASFHFTPQTFRFIQIPANNAPRSPLPHLPAWRAESLPFFCRIEHRWGQKLSLPVKFRLGSVEYVDWLEGKQ